MLFESTSRHNSLLFFPARKGAFRVPLSGYARFWTYWRALVPRWQREHDMRLGSALSRAPARPLTGRPGGWAGVAVKPGLAREEGQKALTLCHTSPRRSSRPSGTSPSCRWRTWGGAAVMRAVSLVGQVRLGVCASGNVTACLEDKSTRERLRNGNPSGGESSRPGSTLKSAGLDGRKGRFGWTWRVSVWCAQVGRWAPTWCAVAAER